MEKAYQEWTKSPTPENMQKLLHSSDSTLNSAITSYGSGNKNLRPSAKMLAMKAFKSYDPNRGTKLRTHLMTQLQPLRRESFKQRSIVRVPERIEADRITLHGASSTFKDAYDRDPSDEELADTTGLSIPRIAQVRGHIRPVSETEYVENYGPNLPGVQQISPEDVWADYVYFDLSPIDKKIMEWKTGIYKHEMLSNMDIAKKLKMTPGAISQRTEINGRTPATPRTSVGTYASRARCFGIPRIG